MHPRDKQEIAARDSCRGRTGVQHVPAASTAGLAPAWTGHLTREAAVFLQRAIGNTAFTRLIGDRRHQQDVGCGHDASPAVESPAARGSTAQRVIVTSTVDDPVNEPGKKPAWPPALTRWGANKSEFFTMAPKNQKERFPGLTTENRKEAFKRYQQDLHDCLLAMQEDPGETYKATSADDLKRIVKDFQNYRKREAAERSRSSEAPGSGSGVASGSGSSSSRAEVLRNYLRGSGRAFPLENIDDLARKAEGRSGSGFLFELQLGKKAIGEDLESRVQFGSMSELSIKDSLGANLSVYQKKRQGPIGADVVVWRPMRTEEADVGVTLEYAAEFIQAKACKFDNLKSNIEAAKNQLEGDNASGQGSNVGQRELSLRGGAHSGTIALEIWDGVRDQGKLKKAVDVALQSDYVQQVTVNDLRDGECYRFPKPQSTS